MLYTFRKFVNKLDKSVRNTVKNAKYTIQKYYESIREQITNAFISHANKITKQIIIPNE